MRFTKWISSWWSHPESLDDRNEALQSDAKILNRNQRIFWDQAVRLMEILNESLQISNNSTNPETKVSRLELSKSKLTTLKLLAIRHPFIVLHRLDDVQRTIDQLTEEFTAAGYYAQTDESRRDYQQDVWKNIGMPIGDIAKGWKFGATMQLRTPLRVLTRHGEIHDGLTDPPAIAREPWEGYWTPIPKNHIEIGIPDVPEILTHHMMASSVGPIPVDGGEYLKFLMRVRAIVEGDSSIEDRRTALREELRRQEWQDFCIKLGGNQNISDQFFPPFIHTIKGLPSDAIAAMWEAGLTTPMQIEKATDATLRAIKGIGPAKLAAIRATCFAVNNKTSEFLDIVCR